MKKESVADMTLKALQVREAELREEHFNLKFQHAIGKLENTSRLSVLRRDIARVLTAKQRRISEEG